MSQQTCKWCGSRRHKPELCPLRAKVRLMKQGIPPEALFDVLVQQDELESFIKDPAAFIKRKRSRN